MLSKHVYGADGVCNRCGHDSLSSGSDTCEDNPTHVLDRIAGMVPNPDYVPVPASVQKPLCPACAFERTYGTTDCPRPVPNLKIHCCGQVCCPRCGGFTIIDGAPIGVFGMFGGDPCPTCNATGRVSGEWHALRCMKIVIDKNNRFRGECLLDRDHAGDCSEKGNRYD